MDDPYLFAQVQSFNSYLCAMLHVAHAHRMRGYRWADDAPAIEAMQRKVPLSVAACHELIEEKMLERTLGDGRSLHDMRSLPVHHGAGLEGDGVAPSDFPK